MRRLGSRLEALERQLSQIAGPELRLILTYTFEEERAAAEAKHGSSSPSCLKLIFKLREAPHA